MGVFFTSSGNIGLSRTLPHVVSIPQCLALLLFISAVQNSNYMMQRAQNKRGTLPTRSVGIDV